MNITALHTAGEAGAGSPGRGPGNNTFPAEYPVDIRAELKHDTNITLEMEIVDVAGQVVVYNKSLAIQPVVAALGGKSLQ